MAPFVIANVDLNGSQNFLAHFADGCSQCCNSFRGVKIKDRKKVLVDEAFVRIETAAREQGVFEAYGGGFSEGSTYVKFIIILQERTVNDVEDLPLMIDPVHLRKQTSNRVKLAL